MRLPAHLTASGRAALALLPAALVRAIFPDRSVFVQRHGAGPTSLTALRALLAEVRRRGYVTEEGELTPGLSSVAAPVLDHHAHPIAGVSVAFPGDAADAAKRERNADQVTRTARELTRRVGGVTMTCRADIGHLARGAPARA